MQLYLVGGFIRDTLLNRKTQDIDIVVDGKVETYARSFARKNKGRLVCLDEINRIYRVIIKPGSEGSFSVDFSARQGKHILDDLSRRDFTVNALAFKLDTPELILQPDRLFQEVKNRRIQREVPSKLETGKLTNN